MKRTIVVLTAAFALAAGAVQAHEIVLLPTEILELDATADGTTVTVSGDVAFGGQAIQDLGSDPAGDNVGGAATAPLGVDITGAQIYWGDPAFDELIFEIRVAELPQTITGFPEGAQYNWDITVDGDKNWSLKVMRTRLFSTQNTDPYGAIYECTQTQTGFSCSELERLNEVEFRREDGVVRLAVPLASIGAQPGSTISGWHRTGSGPLWVAPSASGAFTLGQRFDAMGFHEDYVVPDGKSVLLGIAPAGEEVVFDTPASLDPDDLFSGTLTVPGPGTYTVGAHACFAGNCDTRTIEVEVSG